MAKRLMNTLAFRYNEYDAYLDRLEKHVKELAKRTTKEYKIGNGVIKATEEDMMDNPNGRNKWNGWQKVGTAYRIEVLDKCGAVVTNAQFDDKGEANRYFKEVAKPMCQRMDADVWFN